MSACGATPGSFFVSPTGMAYETLEPEDIPLVTPGRALVRPPPALERVALPPRHHGGPPRGRRHRARPLPLRHRARLHGAGHSRVPLHGGRRRRRGHPLRPVSHVRHTGALGCRAGGARGPHRPVCWRITASSHWAPTCPPRCSWPARSRTSPRSTAPRSRSATWALLDARRWRRVLEKFRTYGRQDAADPGLRAGGEALPPPRA